MHTPHSNAQNPLHTFPRNFHVDGEVANLLRTCYGETGVMDFGLYTVLMGLKHIMLGHSQRRRGLKKIGEEKLRFFDKQLKISDNKIRIKKFKRCQRLLL